MTKRLLKFGIYLGIIFFSIVFYLAYFGIETKNFNNIIEEKILKTNPNLRVELKKIKIFLNLKDLSFNLTTIEPKLYLENNLISLEKISTNLSIDSYLKDTFAIKNIQLSSSEIDINNLIKFARSYNNNAQLFILEKIIKNGSIKINFKAEFDANGTIKDNYTLNGLVENANIKLLNKDKINNINFSFNVTKNQYYFEKINLKLKELDLNSKRFSLLKKKDVFFAEGEITNTTGQVLQLSYVATAGTGYDGSNNSGADYQNWDYLNYENVLTEMDGELLVVTLHRPERHNALTPEMICRLADAFDAFEADPQAAIEAPRFRVYEETRMEIEDRVSPAVRDELSQRGHALELIGDYSLLVGGGHPVEILPDIAIAANFITGIEITLRHQFGTLSSL